MPHPHGPTAHDNLACLCEHHHRLSHQAPGWRLHRDADGTTTRIPPPPARTGRQQYADAIASLRDGYRGPPDPDVPF